MEMDRYDDGVPSWVDLGVPDPQVAADFYGALFGWEAPEGPAEAGGYRVAVLRGRAVAGIGPQMSPGPPYWTTYVSVSDADAVAAAFDTNGGTVVVPPMDVMDQGRMAVCQDCVGAFISLWQPRNHPGAGRVNEPGAFSWCELVTDRVDDAGRFYAAVFGWEPRPTPDGSYVELHLAGRPIGGMMPKAPTMPAELPSYWGVYFAVTDSDAAAAKASELGGSVIVPPFDIPQGRIAVLADPAGAVFNVMALAEGMAG